MKELKLYDQRTLNRHIKQGIVSEEDKAAFLKSIPDDSGNFDEIILEDDVIPDDLQDDSGFFDDPNDSLTLSEETIE